MELLIISPQSLADAAVLDLTPGTPAAPHADTSVNPDSDETSPVTPTAPTTQARNTRGRRAKRVSARRRGGSGVARFTPARDAAQTNRTPTGSTHGVLTRSRTNVN